MNSAPMATVKWQQGYKVAPVDAKVSTHLAESSVNVSQKLLVPPTSFNLLVGTTTISAAEQLLQIIILLP